MTRIRRYARQLVLSTFGFSLIACGGPEVSPDPASLDPLAVYVLQGNTHLVTDPSIIRQGSTYYMFSTDVIGTTTPGSLPIRCSTDEIRWSLCGTVFPKPPDWAAAKIPGLKGLWAPDISYFGGSYHLYYAASTVGSQRSVIGLVTNTTLDSADPAYRWVDHGEVLASVPGDDFNALDPSILVDTDGRVFMTYGSFWSGIKQVQLNPQTGMPLANSPRYDLAMRPGLTLDSIEGTSLVHRGAYYYLFVSLDYCCNTDITTNDYKEAVGRSMSPQGPFVDRNGTPMMSGGSTVLLKGNGIWNAPGGGTVYLDRGTGESLLVFHARHMTEQGAQYAWLKRLAWVDGWPVLL